MGEQLIAQLTRTKNSSQQSNEELSELWKKKPKPRPLLPTLSKLADTTLTCSENNTRKNKKPRLNFNELCLRLTLKSLLGGPSTKPMPFNEPKNWKMLRRNWPTNCKKWKNSSNPPKPSALPWKKPSNDNWVTLKISKSIWNDPTPLLPLWTRNNETSTRFWPNKNNNKKNCKSNSNNPKRKPDLCPPNCSRPRTLTKKPWTVWKLSSENPRICKKKLLT